MIKESPCHNCERRWITETGNCHQTCTEYLEYRKRLASLGKNERDEVYEAYISRAIYKKRKKKNEKHNT